MAVARGLKPKPVTVTDKHFDEIAEKYEAFFNCPKCKDWVEKFDNYCCNCGVKLNWDLKENYN